MNSIGVALLEVLNHGQGLSPVVDGLNTCQKTTLFDEQFMVDGGLQCQGHGQIISRERPFKRAAP